MGKTYKQRTSHNWWDEEEDNNDEYIPRRQFDRLNMRRNARKMKVHDRDRAFDPVEEE